MKKIILASTSPRRKELMTFLNKPFEIQAMEVDESFDTSLTPVEVVQHLAEKKARVVAEKNPDAIVIGSDTIVVYQNEIIGKPDHAQHAREILHKLAGNIHQVYTGVAILAKNHSEIFYEKADVHFYDLTLDEIEEYIATGEPFDKAGAYGIQGYGSNFVEKINGDYFAIVGFPISKVKRKLKDFL